MCDARGSVASPRWGALYAILPVTVAAHVVAGLVLPAPARTATSWALGAAAFGAALRWIRRNRVALDLADWCACAPATIRVRVVGSQAGQPIGPVAAPILAGAGAAEDGELSITPR